MIDFAERSVPERIAALRDELFATPDRVCHERARIATASYRETEGEHWAIRRAKALRAVFAEMPIFIRPGELLVGQRSGELGASMTYPEYDLRHNQADSASPDVADYWRGKTIGDAALALHPERLRVAERELAAGYCTGTSTGFGHVIVDYEKAINTGFVAIADEARAELALIGDDDEGRAFLEAVIIASDGIVAWANRYADLADSLAAAESDSSRASELRTIAEICRRVPAEPARTFHEALQSFWLVHIAMHIEQHGWSISAGRFDQYMFPFYGDDMESGRVTSDQAWELLLSLWVKFMENVGTKIRITTFQNLTLGGRDRDGNDQSNALSHLCLDAMVALGFNQPALSVRWHPGIDPEFWNHAHRALSAGHGMPALFNDEVIVPALTDHGVSPADAVGYGIVGCVETAVPGAMQGLTAGGHVNAAKALELALNGGGSMISGEQIGAPTPLPEAFAGFDDLWRAYVEQAEYLSGLTILASQIAGMVQMQRGHCPLMSSLMNDCIENARDLVAGGTRYDLPGVCIYGNSNACDGLNAIRHVVCEQERISWARLREILLNDFEDAEYERQLLANHQPRFGDGERDVDDLANQANAIHAEFCWKHVGPRDGRFTCGVWPVEGHVGAGYQTAATPDGRRRGAPLADGVGACHGADRSGPTALLRSVAHLNHRDHWTAGNTCNIKFSRSGVSSHGGRERLEALTTTFMDLGGQQLQVNVVDAETLRAAQDDPGAHSELVVRVAGFSAYFTTLSRDVQNEIIARTEQALE